MSDNIYIKNGDLYVNDTNYQKIIDSRVHVTMASGASQAIDGWTTIELDTVVHDGLSEWDAVNYRFNPQNTGYYNISFSTAFGSITANKYILQGIFKNGTLSKRTQYYSVVGGAAFDFSVAADLYLTSSDYIDFRAWINGVINSIGNATSPHELTEASIHRFA